MAQIELVEEERAKGRPKGYLVGLLLIMIGALLVGLSPLFMKAIEFAMLLWLMVLALVVITTGAVAMFEYGSIGRAVPKEATSVLIKGIVIGMGLVALGIVMIIVVVTQLPMQERTLPFFYALGLIFTGIIVTVAGRILYTTRAMRTRFTVPSNISESFRQIGPEKTFETKNFTVLKKAGIYILISKLSNLVYFVKLFNQTTVHEEITKLPIMFFRKTQFKEKIGDLPVAKRRGELIIPVDSVKLPDRKLEEKYARGSGITYIVPFYDPDRQKPSEKPNLLAEFDSTSVLKIMEELSKEE